MIRITMVITLLCLSIFGDTNPRIYSLLGDKLFDANVKLEKFKSIDNLTKKIESYQTNSNLVLNQGLKLESMEMINSTEQKQYLQSLRNLEKRYKSIIGFLEQKLLSTIKNEDYNEFAKLSNSGLDEIFNNSTIQNKAIAHYKKNKNKGVIAILDKLTHEQKLKKQFLAAQKNEASRTIKPKPVVKKQITIEIQSYKDNSVNPYEMKYGISLEECKAFCIKDSRCKTLVLNMKTQRCWLKDSVGRITDSKTGILGIKKTI